MTQSDHGSFTSSERGPQEFSPGDGHIRRREILLAGLYLVFFAVGTVGHYLEVTRDLMLAVTPYVLLVLGLSALVPLFFARAWSSVAWIAGTYVLTFALEAIGVATGLVFGEYTYGTVLGPMVLGVPLIIGFNWVVVVLGGIVIADRLSVRVFRRSPSGGNRALRVILPSLVVGILAVAFDLVLEPVAIHLDYWQWANVSVPIHNYIAWFVIATLVSTPWFSMGTRPKTPLPAFYVVVQLGFILSLLPLAG